MTLLAPSVPLTAAQAALYTAASGGGVAICSPQALVGPDLEPPATAGNAIDLTLALAAATFFTAATLFFRITTRAGRGSDGRRHPPHPALRVMREGPPTGFLAPRLYSPCPDP